MTAATLGMYTLHLDAASYLPVASVSSVDSDPDRKVFGSEARFQNGVPGRLVAAEGLVRPRLRRVRAPRRAGATYPGGPEARDAGLLAGTLVRPSEWAAATREPLCERYQPGRQRGGDEPNIQIGLSYPGQGGMVRLDHYPPGDWEAFKERLGGNFPWTWCSEMREFTVGDAKVTILGGHESFPYTPGLGAVTVVPVTPGHDPPMPTQGTPSVPPFKTEPCPTTPPDRFMAEVRFADATVVINGPLAYGGQDGRPWGAYDTAEALEVVARALRQRQPGE